jgi:hypothetical protein
MRRILNVRTQQPTNIKKASSHLREAREALFRITPTNDAAILVDVINSTQIFLKLAKSALEEDDPKTELFVTVDKSGRPIAQYRKIL